MMNINRKNILLYAAKYDDQYKDEDRLVEEEMKKLLKRQRYLTRTKLIKTGNWKSRRPKRFYRSSDNDYTTVKEVTQFAFGTQSERARIESLFVLKGVSWPLASVILHFAFPAKYPIMDFRTVWSLGWKQPRSYNFAFWEKYCKKIRGISGRYNLPIRTVEKALWKYSKHHQKPRSH